MTKSELVEHFKQSSALPDDWGLIDVDLLRSAIFEVLPMRQEEIEDYDAFLKGKTAIAYGHTPNEKRWLKRHVEAHGGKFRFTYKEGIDIYIIYSLCDIYGLHKVLYVYHRNKDFRRFPLSFQKLFVKPVL